MRISDWSSDVCSSDLAGRSAIDVGCGAGLLAEPLARMGAKVTGVDAAPENIAAARDHAAGQGLAIAYFAGELGALPPATFDLVTRSEEHTSELQSLMRNSYAVFCLKKKN